MRKLVSLLVVTAAGLALAGVAQAGCMATVGISPLVKDGHAAGAPWVVTVRVLQHGRTPLAGATPVVRIKAPGSRTIAFKARPTGRVGSYRARVVFPAEARYVLSVHDGFPVRECARVHGFGDVEIGSDEG